MQLNNYESLSETLYEKKLANGLDVYLLPKNSFSKTYALFTTYYGAIDKTFVPIGKTEEITVPDGIAHFLEHKLFEKEDRDVFSDFLKFGASPNAYTSFTKTAYLFSATKEANKNVETLLDFVQEPFFSDESVEKEKGIIAQEIKMYDDQVDWQSYMGTIKNLFENHPVHTDIAGTVDSIQIITKEDLYTCYNTFYHPKNMSLFITGQFNPEDTMELIEANQSAKQFEPIESIKRNLPDEPEHVARKKHTIQRPVSIPNVTIGIKETASHLRGVEFLKRDLLQGMILSYLFSTSGPYYEELYKAHLIDASFDFSTTLEESFGFSLISTNSENPNAFIDRMRQLLIGTSSLTISEKDFDIMKKKRIGQMLKMMNSIEFIANQFVHYKSVDVDFFTVIPFIQSLTLDEINNFLQKWIHEDKLTSFIIEP